MSGLSGASGAAVESTANPPLAEGSYTSSGTNEVHSPNTPNANEDPEWDFGNGKKFKRSEALKKIQALEKGMHEGFRGRADYQKKYDALSNALSRTGISVEQFLQDPDAHFDRAAQNRIARQMDEQLMDPKERELTRKERELAEREAKYKEWEENQQKTQREQRADQRAQQLSEAMAPALKASGLPANPKTVARMAEVMKAAYRQGVRLEPSEAADYVRDQLQQEQQWHLSQHADAEALASYLGPERMELLRQHLVAQARKKQNPATKPPAARAPARDEQTGKYIGWGDYAKTRRI